jgi:hypothetical protein
MRAGSRIRIPLRLVTAAAVTTAIAFTATGCDLSGSVSVANGAPAATPDATATANSASPSAGSGGGATALPYTPMGGRPVEAQVLAALPKRPAGALPWDKANMPNALGLITAEQFIEADYKPTDWSNERSFQNRDGLQYAARQTWYDPAQGTYVDAFIIHYATAAGAQSYYLGALHAEAKVYDATGTFSVPGIPQSMVFVKTKLDSYGNATALGLGLAGNNVLHIVMLVPAAPDHAAAIALLTGEYKALVSGHTTS